MNSDRRIRLLCGVGLSMLLGCTRSQEMPVSPQAPSTQGSQAIEPGEATRTLQLMAPRDDLQASRPVDLTIKWHGPPGEAAVFIDGRRVGCGREGFLAAVKSVQALPRRGKLRVQYDFPRAFRLDCSDAYEIPDPFSAWPDISATFVETVNDKEICIEAELRLEAEHAEQKRERDYVVSSSDPFVPRQQPAPTNRSLDEERATLPVNVSDDATLLVWPSSIPYQSPVSMGAYRADLSPPQRFFVFRPVNALSGIEDARLLCTIPWQGGDVYVSEHPGRVVVQRAADARPRTHAVDLSTYRRMTLPEQRALRTDLYCVRLALPLDPTTCEELRSLRPKELVIRSEGRAEDTRDIIDVTALASLRIESLVVESLADRGVDLVGIDGMDRLQSLFVHCYGDRPFEIRVLGTLKALICLDVAAPSVKCNVAPSCFPNLRYCRIGARTAEGLGAFLERLPAEDVRLSVVYGLSEVDRSGFRNPTIKHLVIASADDLREEHARTWFPNLCTLNIHGCAHLKDQLWIRESRNEDGPGLK